MKLLHNALAAASVLPFVLGSVPAEDEARVARFSELGLTLTFPQLEGFQADVKDEGLTKGMWGGMLGASKVVIHLALLDNERYGLQTPESALELMELNLQDPANSTFAATGLLDGSFGFVCYAATGRADRHVPGTTRLASNSYFLCGMLDGMGYVVDVECSPALSDKDAEPIRAFFADGIRYEGDTANVAWTDEEAIARYVKDTPEDVHDEMEKILRTDHYIILTNSSGKKAFAKAMEEGYEKIRSVFPFEEIACRKLMPVFLFQNKGEYYAFCQKVAGWDLAQAQGTKGHAWKDYYATWYEAANDPVHVHEATHQIFANRLGLHGGGSWFQEGVAEYIETRDNDRNAIATQVKKGRAMPLRDFFQVRTLVFEGSDDVKGGNQAGDLYKMAALFIEFMRESKLGKDKFPDFISTMGNVPRSDIAEIEAVFEELYGVTVEELEEEFKAYCKKR